MNFIHLDGIEFEQDMLHGEDVILEKIDPYSECITDLKRFSELLGNMILASDGIPDFKEIALHPVF